MKELERIYHVHIKSGFDIKDRKECFIVYDFSWRRRFKAHSMKGLKKGLDLLKNDFESVYSNWGFYL